MARARRQSSVRAVRSPQRQLPTLTTRYQILTAPLCLISSTTPGNNFSYLKTAEHIQRPLLRSLESQVYS